MKEYFKFSHITNRNGLSQNTINSIIQDREGFMWFASQDGLNRYDGYNFKIYKKDRDDKHSISENFLSILYEDLSEEIIWIGSYNSGLIMYDKIRDRFSKLKNMEEIANEYITSITEDGENNLWIGTFYKGIYKYNRRNDRTEKIDLQQLFGDDSIDKSNIMSLQYDKNENMMYAGIWNFGLYKIDLTGNKNEYFRNDKSTNGIISDYVTVLYIDNNRNLWIGTYGGLSRYSIEENTFVHFLHDVNNRHSISGNIISDICEDLNGNIWVGTYGGGLNKYSLSTGMFTNYSTKHDRKSGFICDTIFSMYYDRSNVLWIGIFAEGLLKLDTEQKKFHIINNYDKEFKEDGRNKISSIFAVNEKSILFGTFSNGLYNYRKDNFENSIIKIPQFGNDNIYKITAAEEGSCWITGSKTGLFKFNILQNTVSGYNNLKTSDYTQILSVCKIKSDHDLLLAGTRNEGIKLFDSGNEIILEDNIIKDSRDFEVKSMFIDSDNNLWIATTPKGLIVFRNILISKEKIVLENYENFDCGNTVLCIHEDKEENIWAGSSANGLCKIQNGKKISRIYTEKDGLSNNCVLGILEDENEDLWLSTGKGLSRFNKKYKTFKNYDITDGLDNLEFNDGAYCKYEDGTMYFGGNDGINYFKPDEINDNPFIPDISITDFQIFYSSVKGSPENPFLKTNILFAKYITLSYNQSVFSFEFAALVFNNPQKNQYAYKMEGFDDEWVYCGTRRTATYTNLDPGEYIFRVKGSNNDGLWNEEGTSINVSISPPWYRTLLFKGLVGLSVIGSIGSFYQKRIQKLNKEKSQQEEFTRKLIESQENERKRVAAELHDSLGQDLLIIKNKALVNIKKAKDEDSKKQMQEISDLSSTALNEVREISYNLRPFELDRLGLTKTITSMISRANSSTNIDFNGSIDDIDKIFLPEVEINIYRILQENLNNIIKHSEAKQVELSVLKKVKEIVINISDNGKGFDISKFKFNTKRNGFGLKGIEERVRLLNGEFKIESSEGIGTKVMISIPVN
ncbi:MAG TPA: two-component regulator propeller domain-containing protein [Ignavibacteria bacterium]|nr:two-component regulator propeller domain-containing protein [Ignavibacteria bacterium]